ncbi:hypothetical protein LC608_18220 [Nostoc sp. XA010]|uniref:hypothetical protein n=1 Tax=Nostoc sp. XA010 TaxID=2780407 RepID=UPI001E537DA2|nr:hypothetical protein [Nostoc sp. XA010]MCC5658885.1 hypothetical protein [Nostoc sp. XA010]
MSLNIKPLFPNVARKVVLSVVLLKEAVLAGEANHTNSQFAMTLVPLYETLRER